MSLLKKFSPAPSKELTVCAPELSDAQADAGIVSISNAQALCFHCLEPTPKYSQIFANIDGRMQPMCCYGCKAAAEFIDGKSLSDFYVHRQQRGQNRFFAKVARKASESESHKEWQYLDEQSTASDYVSFDQQGQRTIDLMVSGLYCSSCSWLIDKALKQLSADIEVRIQLDAKRMNITIGSEATSLPLSRVFQVISDLGYKPTPLMLHRSLQDLDTQRAMESRQAIKRILVAGFGMMQVMTYAIALYLGEVQGMDASQHRFLTLVSMLVATVVVFYAGKPFFINALNDLSNRHFGMDVPIAFAIAGAYFPSAYDALIGSGQNVYFDSAVMFIFFLLIGRYVEMRARHRLSDAPNALMRLLPTRVNVQRFIGSELVTRSIKPQHVALGDQLQLSVGNVVPFDADIVGGDAYIDESLLTGEVRPVPKVAGDPLLAGSKVLSGILSTEARCVWEASSIVKIETLLKGNRHKVGHQSRLQRFSQVFVLAVLILTTIVGVFWWFYDASRVFEISLAMLIASCPCAFALAIPVGSTAASNTLRKQGVLLANSDALQKLWTVTNWCFDKTGTLTQGQMSLHRVTCLSVKPEKDCVYIAAALERLSRHSLARAFINVETPLIAHDITEIAGNGISGVVNGESYFLGKRDWVLKQAGLHSDETLPAYDKRCSEMLLASDQTPLALIFVSDELRAGVREVLAFLTEHKKQVAILSGDTPSAVASMAGDLGIENAIGALLPEQKMQRISSAHASGQVVAMVGDGLNDAPIMSQADLSVAMASGSELTQSQADVVLLNSRLDTLITLHQVARLSQKITNQNLTWALLYNAVVLPLAALGYLSPWIAALGMSSSSLLVVLNALRIRARDTL